MADTLTILPSATRTIAGSPYNSADFSNRYATGIELFVDVTANVGVFSLTVKLQAKDPVGGQYVDVVGAATPAIAATGLTRLVVWPDITTVSANVAVSQLLPRTFRAVATITGAGTSATFSVTGTR